MQLLPYQGPRLLKSAIDNSHDSAMSKKKEKKTERVAISANTAVRGCSLPQKWHQHNRTTPLHQQEVADKTRIPSPALSRQLEWQDKKMSLPLLTQGAYWVRLLAPTGRQNTKAAFTRCLRPTIQRQTCQKSFADTCQSQSCFGAVSQFPSFFYFRRNLSQDSHPWSRAAGPHQISAHWCLALQQFALHRCRLQLSLPNFLVTSDRMFSQLVRFF